MIRWPSSVETTVMSATFVIPSAATSVRDSSSPSGTVRSMPAMRNSFRPSIRRYVSDARSMTELIFTVPFAAPVPRLAGEMPDTASRMSCESVAPTYSVLRGARNSSSSLSNDPPIIG